MMASPFSVPATEMTALLETAGFTGVALSRIELMVSFPAVPDLGARMIVAAPVAALFKQAPVAAQEAVAAAVAEVAEQFTDGDTVSFPMYSNVASGVA